MKTSLKPTGETSLNDTYNTLSVAENVYDELNRMYSVLSSGYYKGQEIQITAQQKESLVQNISILHDYIKRDSESYEATKVNLQNVSEEGLGSLDNSKFSEDDRKLVQAVWLGIDGVLDSSSAHKLGDEFHYRLNTLANSDEYNGNDVVRTTIRQLIDEVDKIISYYRSRRVYLSDATLAGKIAINAA